MGKWKSRGDSAAVMQAEAAGSALPPYGWRERFALWRARAASRRLLGCLDERMLRDIGIDPAERWREARKRFWRA